MVLPGELVNFMLAKLCDMGKYIFLEILVDNIVICVSFLVKGEGKRREKISKKVVLKSFKYKFLNR